VICHAPWELVSAGLVRGRTLTGYHTIQDDIRNAGGRWEDREVVEDGNWVTSRQPKDLPAFNRAMIRLFARGPAGKTNGSGATPAAVVNPDPHREGYRYMPTHRVTALFDRREQADEAVKFLRQGGFADGQIEVFAGDAGAEKLDVEGKHHGALAWFLRLLEPLYSDEAELRMEVDKTLRAGGAALDVFVGDDEERKRRAAALIRDHHGRNVCYWGRWTLERL